MEQVYNGEKNLSRNNRRSIFRDTSTQGRTRVEFVNW